MSPCLYLSLVCPCPAVEHLSTCRKKGATGGAAKTKEAVNDALRKGASVSLIITAIASCPTCVTLSSYIAAERPYSDGGFSAKNFTLDQAAKFSSLIKFKFK